MQKLPLNQMENDSLPSKFKVLFQTILRLIMKKESIYRISTVHPGSKQIIFQIRNTGIFLRCSFSEAISNSSLINELTPIEACFLGGYYGRMLRGTLGEKKALKKSLEMNFLLRYEKSIYKIIFQNRDGKIGYINQKNKKEFLEYPLTMANEHYIISRFNQTQACYIGILAGISMEKAINFDDKTGQNTFHALMRQRPQLRTVD